MELVVDMTWKGARVVGAMTDALELPGASERALRDVSHYRREKAQAFRFGRDRDLSLLAGLLLDVLLQEHGLRERDRLYYVNEHGKPFFADCPALQFSLAHSGRMALAALCDRPVGVDVEHLPTFPYDIADPRDWTEMESVGKALGTGIGSFVDAGRFVVPRDFRIMHIDCDGYLVCIAQRLQ